MRPESSALLLAIALVMAGPASVVRGQAPAERADGCSVMKALSSWIPKECVGEAEALNEGAVDLNAVGPNRSGLEFRSFVLEVPPEDRVPNAPSGMTTRMINFKLNSAEIEPSSEPVLNEIVTTLIADPAGRFLIEGHTDRSGGSDHNRRLSDARARAVVEYLKTKNVSPDRLRWTGLGDMRPLKNLLPTDPYNRRVEITPVTAKDGG